MAQRTFDLVVVANRLPITRVDCGPGATSWQCSPGGLVSALEPVMRTRQAAWVGWAGEPGPAPGPFQQGGPYLRPVALSSSEVEQYYEGFSNATLWPLFHGAVVPLVLHRAWWHAYRTVNERFARAVVEVAGPGSSVWVHDYHFQLVPQIVRELRPDVRIGWFNHIPFPPLELFERLPWARPMLEGVLGADLLGFQRVVDAENFLHACRMLLGLRTPDHTVTVTSEAGDRPGRTVRVEAVPISVDFTGLDTLARTPEVVAGAAVLRASLGDPEVLVLGVDRLDYTKGIRHRLKAYGELLRDGMLTPPRAAFVQVGMVSREQIDAYRILRAEIEDAVRRINTEYSTAGVDAVHLREEYYSPSDRAAMFLAADVMLVTPLRDGMNLVAKEYVACRHDLGGALVLSRFTGAWDELREAFPCNPYDIDDLKQAVMTAVTTSDHERRRRMQALRGHVAAHDVQRWASEYLDALACASSPSRPRPERPGDTHRPS